MLAFNRSILCRKSSSVLQILRPLHFCHRTESENEHQIRNTFMNTVGTVGQSLEMHSLKKTKRLYTTTINKVIQTDLSQDKKNALVTWEDNKQSSFYSHWLRLNCQCPECVDPEISQPQLAVEKIPISLTLNDFSVSENGLVKVTWVEETHSGVLSTDFLREHCYSDWNRAAMREQIKPVFYTNNEIPSLPWKDVERYDEVFYTWLRHVNERGICLLTGVPVEKNYIKKVIEKIGYVTGTMYGEIFDVKALDTHIATNRAYTNQRLHFHMDQAYYESSPGVQFFHCLEFDDSIKGGNTLFVDIFHVLEEFRVEYPEEFRTLCQVPATFSRIHDKRENPLHMVHAKPLVVLNDNGEIIGAHHHPHAMGSPLVTGDNVEQFYRAYQLLCRKVENFPYAKSIRYKPGDLICANNRRMAHGRDAFDRNGGTRYLQGAYMSVDDFKSKLIVLSKKFDGGRPARRVGNNDWI